MKIVLLAAGQSSRVTPLKDKNFLDFMVDFFAKDGKSIDDPSGWACPNGTVEGGRGYTVGELVEQVKTDRDLYDSFQESFGELFEAYKKRYHNFLL